MELTFNKNEKSDWVAEFEATGDFNLHLERDLKGTITILLKQNEEDEYAFSSEFPNYYKIFDYDFAALLYPKYIKVISDSKVIKGSVNFNEGGGSGSGSSDGIAMEYYRIDWNNVDDSYMLRDIISMSYIFNADVSGVIRIMTGTYHAFDSMADVFYAKIGGPNIPIINHSNDGDYFEYNNGSWLKNITAYISGEPFIPSYLVPITKEEFYNLEA